MAFPQFLGTVSFEAGACKPEIILVLALIPTMAHIWNALTIDRYKCGKTCWKLW